MALRVIEGVPGAGKTFYAVWHLVRNYFKKKFIGDEPVYGFFLNLLYALLPFLKPERDSVYELSRDCTIITNIDGFKPAHVDLNREIKKAGLLARERIENSPDLTDRRRQAELDSLDPVAEFFSFAYQEKYKDGKPQIVYVIDEAQRLFRKGVEKSLKEKEVFSYFEYHRHWGQDIYLVTQNVKKLPADIVQLPEYIVSAVPRVRALGRSFRYHWMASGERIKTEVRRPDRGVFALYKSMDVAEQEKIKNPVLKTVGLALLGSFVILFYGYSYISKRFHPDPSPAVAASSAVPAGSSSASSSSAPAVASDLLPSGDSAPAAEPRRKYIVFVPLSSITRPFQGRIQRLYVWRGQLLPAGFFPYKTASFSGSLYAVLDYDLFEFIFSEDEERPSDFIVQVDSSQTPSATQAESFSGPPARSDLSGGGGPGKAPPRSRMKKQSV